MTDRMVSSNDPSRVERVEVITSVQRRRHWTTQEKVRLVEETDLPGQSVSLVARRHGLNADKLFTWRRLMERGAFTVHPIDRARAAQSLPAAIQQALGCKEVECDFRAYLGERRLGGHAVQREIDCARPLPQPWLS